MSPEQIAQLDALGFCWDPLVAEWDKSYAELVAYKEAHGHLRTGKSNTLGNWCGVQRVCYKQGKLSLERIAKLEAIGFPWDAHEELWDRSYAELVAYKEVHGHCTINRENSSLSAWCSNQRESRKKGNITQEQIARLNALGFCWDPNDALLDLWDKRYADLVAYKEVHGACDVSKENGGSLGRWCHNLRARKATLSTERIAQLDALGFCWGNTKDVARKTLHEKFIADLTKFRAVHGHCNVRERRSDPNYPYKRLAGRCTYIRAAYRNGKLSDQEIAEINALGFCWDHLRIWMRKRRVQSTD